MNEPVNDERLEELLWERSRRREERGLFSEETRRRLRADLAREEPPRLRSLPRPMMWAGLAAAAAVLAMFLVPHFLGQNPDSYGSLPLQVALLDPSGRPLESTLRSASNPLPFRPDRMIVEALTEQPGQVRIYFFGADGERQDPEAGASLTVADELMRVYPLPAAGNGEFTVLLVSSLAPIPATELDSRLPEMLQGQSSAQRAAELEALRASLEARFGCSVSIQTVRLAGD